MYTEKKLLVVDDNLINRSILCKIVKDEYTVLETENGREALAILNHEKESISAVLLDLNMPVMDGYEVMKTMREDAFLSQIPIIVTTGSNASETENKALSMGANDFIVKPYQRSIIRHRIANTVKLRETAALINTVQKDELTGLLKKEFFYQQVSKVISNNTKKFDSICCNIERFKLVNDLFGIRVGNDLLRYIAMLMKRHLSEEVVAGRIGADQFACLTPHRPAYENGIFERAIQAVNEFPITIQINMFFDIYMIHDTDIPFSVMCDRALIACNSARGKYDAHYDDAIRKRSLFEQTVLGEMKNAL
ncbi:MAG: response regulator [Oscillibacter sp.]|nr:response regulator [Oscillibacter sp.]